MTARALYVPPLPRNRTRRRQLRGRMPIGDERRRNVIADLRGFGIDLGRNLIAYRDTIGGIG